MKKIRDYISRGYIVLLITGLFCGFVTAVFSTLPVFVSPQSEISFSFISLLVTLILVNGFLWIWMPSGNRLRSVKNTEELRTE